MTASNLATSMEPDQGPPSMPLKSGPSQGDTLAWRAPAHSTTKQEAVATAVYGAKYKGCDYKDPIQESVAHAFAECLDVMALWNYAVEVIRKLHPDSGDGEPIAAGSLKSVFHQNLRRRAQDDWIRACQQDKANNTRPIRAGDDLPE
ncbi:hypothetical protein BG005_004289, partial [Podila minutissima]